MSTKRMLSLVVAFALGCSGSGPSTKQPPAPARSATPEQDAAVQTLITSVKKQDSAAIRASVRTVKDTQAEKLAVESLTAFLGELESKDRADQQMIDNHSIPPEGKHGRFDAAEQALKNAERIKGFRERINQRSDLRHYVVYGRLLVQDSPLGPKPPWDADSYLAVSLLIEDLKSTEKTTVVRACRILERIGRMAEKALPQLDELVKKNDEAMSPHAERAIKAIRN